MSATAVGKTHVLFIADVGVRGGATEALYELCKQLVGTGRYSCTVLTSQRSSFNDSLEAIGVRTVVTHHGAFLVPRPVSWWKAPAKYLVFLARYLYGLCVSARTAEAAIDFGDVDVIHTNVPRNDLGLILAQRHHIPHVVHLRECSFSHFRCWSYRYNPVAYLNKGTDAFVGISRYVAGYWEGLGIPRDKVSVIYDGVEVPVGVRKHAGSDTGPLRLLFLGGYVEAKGVWDAVRAMPILLRRFPSGLTLDIYGGGASETRSAISGYVEEQRLSGVVRLHGETNDVWQVIPEFDVGLACSTDEAFGRTVIEYQACGVVPLVSDSGAFTETVTDGSNGLVYEKARGSEALSDRVAELIECPQFLHALSDRALEASERFTAQKNCEGIQALYERLA